MDNKQSTSQIIRFTLFSISAGIIQALVFAFLFELLGFAYWLAYILALMSLVLWNTTFNRKYTFQSTVKYKTAVSKLMLFYLFFTPFSTWGGNALIQQEWNAYGVLVLTMVINHVLAFFYNKYFIYHKK
ncbi:MAG: GtrA family protein [Bacilli bacterium]|nr:GtrA family protein [Bacilli bacterium]